jgi:hypothetical protein
MKVKVKTLRTVVDLLVEKTGDTPDFSGFREMSDKIKLPNPDYLYKKIHQRIKNERDSVHVGLQLFSLNLIAKYLGWNSFRDLELSLFQGATPQLQSLVGTYYCYVRANLPEGMLLKSPVRIFERERKIWFELRGPSIEYKGEVTSREGCLFILMTSKVGKTFHHVYKIGSRHSPGVLQGVFSGVSTAFDPIGGRTVLVRQREDVSKLNNTSTAILTLTKSKNEEERRLAQYFKFYENNNVAPAKSATFSFKDLK